MTLKRLPIHHLHVQRGAKIVPFAGFEMPVRYTSDIAEHMAVRQNAGVFDVSHMGEFIVSGPAALDLIQVVSSNDASRLQIGQAQYACLPNDAGGIVDDLVIYRLEEHRYMLVVNAANIEKDWNWIAHHNNAGAEMLNISDELCLFAVQGPHATQVLQSLTKADLPKIPYYHFAQHVFAGAAGVIISNTGYTGAGGFELYVPTPDAEKVWLGIFRAGAATGIQPAGLGARDTLRLEMGYCLYGNDINDTTSPLEAGLGWITRFTKPFINSENLMRQKEEGVQRKLVGFKMVDRGIPRQGYALKDTSGNTIGVVTSGSQSPVLGIGIGLGYVTSAFSKAGTPLRVEVRGRDLAVEITKVPFIK